MKSDLKRAPDNTIQLTITIPWEDVQKAREDIVNELAKELTVPGFRKGAAPKDMAAAKLPKEKVQEEVLKKVVTKAYNEVLEKENIKPIITPKVHVDAFDEGTPLTFTAETCEEPTVTLKDYKDAVGKITAKAKIIVPGRSAEEAQKPNMDEILQAAIDATEVTIPQIMIEQETNRLLSQLLDELKSLGLTVDQYVSTRGKTTEDLRKEYEEKAARDLKLEFMLRKIADVEKISVEQKDVDEVLASLKDEKQKAEVLKNPYFLAAIIRQQKTLDFLSKL